MQAQYDDYVRQELVPFIHDHCGSPGLALTTTGASFGAYHAANTPTSTTPSTTCATLSDPWYLERLRGCDIRLVTGTGPWESAEPSYKLSEALSSRGIPHSVGNWGPEGGHDWPLWKRQLDRYIDALYWSPKPIGVAAWRQRDRPEASPIVCDYCPLPPRRLARALRFPAGAASKKEWDVELQPDLSVIVPAYNEVARIASTLASIGAHLDRRGTRYEIIVVADGDDGTREAVAELGRHDPRVRVLGQPGRGGKGRGVRLGFQQACGRILGFVDADNKTPIEELEKLLPWFEREYDIVIGSRGQVDSQVEVAQPWHRRLGSQGFGVFMRLTTSLTLRDTQCGFKLFRAEVARDLFARQVVDGYMFDVEVLYLAARSGYRIREVGVRWRDDGDSRLELLAGNWRNLKDVLGIRLRRYPVGETRAAMSEEHS